MSYINIHTHFKPRFSNEFALRNGYMFALQVDRLGYEVSNGLHPWFTNEPFNVLELKRILDQNSSMAIGECGIDRLKGAELKVQQKIFDQHLNLAHECKLPVIVHCVRAYDEVWNMVKDSEVPIILHGFSGSEKQWERFSEREKIFFSLGIREMKRLKFLEKLNVEQVLLETDSEYYTIKDVYEEYAKFKSCQVSEIKACINTNISKLGMDVKLL